QPHDLIRTWIRRRASDQDLLVAGGQDQNEKAEGSQNPAEHDEILHLAEERRRFSFGCRVLQSVCPRLGKIRAEALREMTRHRMLRRIAYVRRNRCCALVGVLCFFILLNPLMAGSAVGGSML